MNFRRNKRDSNYSMVFQLGLLLSTLFVLASFTSVQATEKIEWGPYLTVGDGPTIVVNWKTDRATRGKVSYATDDYHMENDGFSDSIAEEEAKKFHHVRLSGLNPGTEHVYRVESGSDSSGVNYFGSLAEEAEDFSFFVYGDNRTCGKRHRIVTSRMALDPFDPAFIFHTGDLVERPVAHRWDDFFSAIEPFSKSTPLVPVLGNHERNDESYYRAFALPTGGGTYKEGWYSFEYGPVNFVLLDSNVNQLGLGKFSEEREWLERELENQTEPFTVAFFHHPIYSSIYSTGKNSGLADSWGVLFEKYGVDLVFTGHVHAYERLVKNGVTYVITGGGGAPTDNISSRFDFSRKARGDSLHYVRVSVTGSGLQLQTIEVARVVRDGRSGRLGCDSELTVKRSVVDEALINND